MKLLVLLAVVAGLWWLRRLAQVGRLARQLRQMREAPPPPTPQPILPGGVCGTQTPPTEAVPNSPGAVLSAAHQAQAAQDASSRPGERKE